MLSRTSLSGSCDGGFRGARRPRARALRSVHVCVSVPGTGCHWPSIGCCVSALPLGFLFSFWSYLCSLSDTPCTRVSPHQRQQQCRTDTDSASEQTWPRNGGPLDEPTPPFGSLEPPIHAPQRPLPLQTPFFQNTLLPSRPPPRILGRGKHGSRFMFGWVGKMPGLRMRRGSSLAHATSHSSIATAIRDPTASVSVA